MEAPVSVLDTNILVDALHNIPAAVFTLKGCTPARISRITWMEILTGAADKDEERELESFLRRFHVQEITETVAREAVRLRRAHRLKLPDAIILATARCLGESLVTRNTKDFHPSWPGVEVPYSI
jgi:hypothetical protein